MDWNESSIGGGPLTYAAALLSILFFAMGWQVFGVPFALRNASASRTRSIFSIAGRVAGAAAISLLPLSSFHSFGLARFADVTQILATWRGVLMAFALMTLSYLFTTRR
jgi:hypothetical protein